MSNSKVTKQKPKNTKQANKFLNDALALQQTYHQLLQNSQQRVNELSAITNVSKVINSAIDQHSLFIAILNETLKLTQAENASIMTINDETQELILQAAKGTKDYVPTKKTFKFKVGKGIAGWVAKNKIHLLVNNTEVDKRFISLSKKNSHTVKSIFCLPLIKEDKVIGVLNISSTKKNTFSETSVEILTVLAGEIAQAIIKANLYEEIKKLSDLKSELVSLVSHELRTPLTAIKGFTTTLISLRHKLNDDEKIRFYKIIKNESERLIRMVESILDVSVIEAGGALQFKTTEIKVKELISKILEILQLSSKPHNFIIKIVPEDLSVNCDEDRITQILLNIITNAKKYTPPNKDITINIKQNKTYICFSVKDKGSGISPEKISNIFKKFSEDKNMPYSLSRGLGLYLTKTLVEKQGGKVSLKSALGRGTKVTVKLPLLANKRL